MCADTFQYRRFHCSTEKFLGNTASEKLFAAESEEKSLNRLFLQIEVAEQYRDEAVDISDALCDLSQHYSATAVLIREYSNLILDAEKKWQEIERSDDFKAKYTSREEARMDFLKFYFTKGAKA